MANQIALGVEVDSSDVKSGEAAFARLTKQLHATQAEMDRLAKSSSVVDTEIRRAAKSNGALDAAGKSAASQVTRLNGALQGTASLARAVQGAFAAFVGAGMVRSLIDTTTQLQKIDQTFLAVTGSSEAAAAQMEYVTATADKLGQSVLTTATAYSKLLAASQASNIPLQDTRNVFEGLTAAASAFGLSQYELEGALNAVQQMISKGVVQAEELRGQLGDRLPGVFAIAAESMGMTVAEFSKQLELGNIASAKFVANFGPAMQAKFQAFAESADSSQQQINRLGNAMLALRKAIVEGGFADALANILGTLTSIASSQEAVTVANALGAAFKLISDYGEPAALTLGVIASAFIGLPGLIAGASAALLLFTQRTVTVGAEHVKIGAIISAFWNSVVNSAKAGGELVAAVWNYIAESAKAIPTRLAIVWSQVKTGFLEMVSIIAKNWSNLMGTLAEQAAKIPTIGDRISESLTAASQSAASFAHEVGTGLVDSIAHTRDLRDSLGATGAAAANVSAKFQAFQAADANATVAHAQAVAAAERGAENDRMEKLDGLKKMAGATDNLTGSTGALADATTKAGGAAKKQADELAGAKKILEEFALANQRAREALTAGLTTDRNNAITEGVQKLQDALHGTNTSMEQFLKTAGYTREQFEAMLGNTYDMTAQLSKQADLVGSIADGLKRFQKGDLAGGGTSIVQGISDALFGDAMNQALDDVATKLSNAIKDATSKSGLLSGNAQLTSQVGGGIAAAAIGGMNEDAGAVGAGIGQAAGAVLGSFIPGVGTAIGSVLGALAGGGLAKALSGGSDFKRMGGVAFEGTPYQRSVKTEDSLKVGREDRALEGRFAFLAVKDILKDFQGALTDYVKTTGGTVMAGTRLVVDQKKALEAITGAVTEKDITAHGAEGKEAGERIQARVAEIMAIAGLIVQKAEPQLTEAQRLWREAQKKFSDENVAILRDLGFSGVQIAKAQKAVREDIVSAFDQEMANALIDTGRATKQQLDVWKQIETKSLFERRSQAIATAKEIGANVDMVLANFAGQRAEIVGKWKEMVDALTPPIEAKISNRERLDFADAIFDQLTTINKGAAASRSAIQHWYVIQVAIAKDNRIQMIAEAKRLGLSVLAVNRLYNQQIIEINKARDDLLTAKAREAAQAQVTAVTAILGRLNDRMKDLVSERSDVMQELTKRANEARQAEEALADARKNLAVSTLAPGGPLDVFRELQAQFNRSISAAKGGDAGAASDAARLAQQLLEAGRNVFGSSTGYANLFKSVNTSLTGVQGVFDKEADRIEAVLDKETFADVTEKSTTALLKALGSIDATMDRVQKSIDAQTAKLTTAQAKSKVA